MTDPNFTTADLARDAAENGVLAMEPINVGDHGLLVRRPATWVAEVIDVRPQEDTSRERVGTLPFTTVESLVRYVNRYSSSDSLGYMVDVTGRGSNTLTDNTVAAMYVLDDFAEDLSLPIGNRRHRATLVLQPTTAARRWGKALGTSLTQHGMVELVADGVGEIANPPAADLRDLISDLHAIRTTSAKSVVRTGGGVAVELAENVGLHAGPGHLVAVPEQLTLVLQPWTAVDTIISVAVKIRPVVTGETVTFRLDAPQLEEALNAVLLAVHDQLADTKYQGTGIEPLWTSVL